MSFVTRLGVVSDTHLPRFGRALPTPLLRALDGVDAILHLGDFTGDETPALFEALAPFEAVAGNNDGPALHARFARRLIISVAGIRIGMVHGDSPTARQPARLYARQAFGDAPLALLCYGHSHIPELVQEGPRLVLNPGSPTDKRRMKDYSCALVTVRDGLIDAQLIRWT